MLMGSSREQHEQVPSWRFSRQPPHAVHRHARCLVAPHAKQSGQVPIVTWPLRWQRPHNPLVK